MWLMAALTLSAVGAALIQARLPLSHVWAMLDVVIHGCFGAACMVGSMPRLGGGMIVVSGGAGILIDLDHLIAARSADPMAMMSLNARPPAHSLIGVVVLALAVGLLSRWRFAYAALTGMLAHLLWDCVSPPGVVLFYPFLAHTSVVLPVWAVFTGLLSVSLAHWRVGASAGRTAAYTRRLERV
jgi:membrane-bound metal-dependent hydrolase YbcI (DUF457 family)